MTSIRSASWMLAFAALHLGCTHQTEAVNGDAAVPAAVASDSAAVATPEVMPAPPTPPAQPAPEDPAEVACVDRWLGENKLDRFGSPEGTMYTGGTPLFDERTGTSTPRLPFVYGRHAAAKAACRPDAGVSPSGPATE